MRDTDKKRSAAEHPSEQLGKDCHAQDLHPGHPETHHLPRARTHARVGAWIPVTHIDAKRFLGSTKWRRRDGSGPPGRGMTHVRHMVCEDVALHATVQHTRSTVPQQPY